MIRSKAQMLRVMKNCDGADTLTREQKFQVFVRVCDNMLNEGRITKANHTRWTNIFLIMKWEVKLLSRWVSIY